MAPPSKGQRLIIMHAGTDKGFIPGAVLIVKSNRTTGGLSQRNEVRIILEMPLPFVCGTATCTY
jgi:hypothetical protein